VRVVVAVVLVKFWCEILWLYLENKPINQSFYVTFKTLLLHSKCQNGTISIFPSSTFITHVAIFKFYLHIMFMPRSWLGMQEIVRHVISVSFEAVCWQSSWCHWGFCSLVYRQLTATFTVVTKI
jgi:hypothetical protein